MSIARSLASRLHPELRRLANVARECRSCKIPSAALPANTRSFMSVSMLRQRSWLRLGPQATIGDTAFVSTKASRDLRRKKKKGGRIESIAPPKRVLLARDGDFPVQVRPTKAPPIRDLQDRALDDEDSGEWREAPKVKPHKMRQAILTRVSQPITEEVGGLADEKDLKAKRLQVSKVAAFNPERDLGPEAAAELQASKARALAKRNYKHMPNPYSARPGPLGLSRDDEAQYYARYFDGRHLAEEGRTHPVAGVKGDAEEFTEAKSPKPRRVRISPKQFWIRPDYVTPDPPSVEFMNSQELKYAMMNEAHLVRKWRNEQAEGRAAGMPFGSLRVWMAFGYRAAQLSCSGPTTTVDGGTAASADGSSARRPRSQRCSLSTTLRFLQAMASVQAGPYSALYRLAGSALDNHKRMKPRECFFFLQALSRLRLRHPRAHLVLQKLAPTWKALPMKHFIKAANAVAKLDLASNLWARALKVALLSIVPRMTGRELAKLKAITVMELLDDSEAMKAYLERCEQERAAFWYTRHLQVVELHTHLLHPELWERLDEPIRYFLQEVREAANVGRADHGTLAQPVDAGIQRQAAGADSATSSDSDSDGEEESVRKPRFDRNKYSSSLHSELSRILETVLQVEHSNRLAAGPLTLDICHTPTMTVVEAEAPWQFYLRSSQATAMARRRQEMLQAMGFRLVNVPYHRWSVLQDDEKKAAYLRSVLPSEVLSHARTQRLASC